MDGEAPPSSPEAPEDSPPYAVALPAEVARRELEESSQAVATEETPGKATAEAQEGSTNVVADRIELPTPSDAATSPGVAEEAAVDKSASAAAASPEPAEPAEPLVWDVLPTGEALEDEVARDALFKNLDPNGNKQLSLTEVQTGLHSVMHTKKEKNKKREGLALESLIPGITDFKTMASLAFKLAQKGAKGHHGVGRSEFHDLLVLFRRCVELMALFKEADDSGDKQVTLDEARTVLPQLASWSVDEQRLKNKFGTSGHGIPFSAFAEWALVQKQLGDSTVDQPCDEPNDGNPAESTAVEQVVDPSGETSDAQMFAGGSQVEGNAGARVAAVLPEGAVAAGVHELPRPPPAGAPSPADTVMPPQGEGPDDLVPESASPAAQSRDGVAAGNGCDGPAAAPGVARPPRRAVAAGLTAAEGASPHNTLVGFSFASASSLGGSGRPAFLTSLSKYRSLPKVSMGTRTGGCTCIRSNSNPGPASYDLVDGNRYSKYHQQPTYGFGGGSRFGLGCNPTKEKPGPGKYGVPADLGKYRAEPRVGFTVAARGRPNGIPHQAPGPGAYELKGTLNDGPMVTFQGRRYRTRVRSLLKPGPGTYDPSQQQTSKYPTTTKVGFGTSARNTIVPDEAPAPGPGAYELQKYKNVGTDSAKFSVTSRRQTHDLMPYLQPGPGMYAAHATSFGY